MADPTARPHTVHPARRLGGRFTAPGDKSITHRALILGALAAGETTVENANPGADCAATAACLGALGARIAVHGTERIVRGTAGRLTAPSRPLDCGNSGTTLRLLAGPLAAQSFRAVLDGDDSLRRRPVARVIAPLRRMGATLQARDGDRYPPLEIRGAALEPIHYPLEIASAQVASCVLLAGLFAGGRTTVALPRPARDHTERMLPAFGAEVAIGAGDAGPEISVQGPVTLRGTRVRVPGDFSAAAFFLALAAATPGAEVTALQVGLNPTRTGLLDVLERMGAVVERGAVHLESGEPVGDVTVRGGDRLVAATIGPEELPRLLDEVPAWAIAAARAEGRSRLAGAGELRVKESDRLAALAENLRAVGIEAEDRGDSLEIHGGAVRGGAVAARGDHRVAMAFAALGTLAREPVAVDDVRSIDTSFPGFMDILGSLTSQT